jgi:ABC-type multidrug transport system ATPase subunit
MWQLIRDLVAGGVTVFLTTQYLEEADELADRIALLDRGRVVAEGTPAELKRLVPGGHIRLEFADPAALDSAAGCSAGPRPTTRSSSRCRATAASRRCAPSSSASTRSRSPSPA